MTSIKLSLLIEHWLPTEAIGAESKRERGASSARHAAADRALDALQCSGCKGTVLPIRTGMEACHWYSKCPSGPDLEGARKALRLLLAEE